MKVTSDPTVRSVYVAFRPAEIVDSDELAPGVVVDYAPGDAIVGLELLDVPAPSTEIMETPPDLRAACLYVQSVLVHRGVDEAILQAVMEALEHEAAV